MRILYPSLEETQKEGKYELYIDSSVNDANRKNDVLSFDLLLRKPYFFVDKKLNRISYIAPHFKNKENLEYFWDGLLGGLFPHVLVFDSLDDFENYWELYQFDILPPGQIFAEMLLE